jgi:TolB-like protein/Tfp pilus assembly protein PilF
VSEPSPASATGRPNQQPADRLDSWKDIAAYLTRDVSTVQRWEKREGMPVHRHLHDKLGSVYAFRAELDAWWQTRRVRLEREEEQGSEALAGAETARGAGGTLFPRRWRMLAALGVLGLGAAVYLLIESRTDTATRPEVTSLAVLPLQNLSGDPTQDYFADGVTEALISNLARIRALRVVSRTSVMRFKGTQITLSDIARELHVDAVIEGSVQRVGDRVRISIQLIHAPTDTHLWAREYEGELTDVLKLQGEVARAVAEEIRIQVTAEEGARIASAGTVNPAAHQEYLLGRYHVGKFIEEDSKRAIDHFERALQIDPKYAAAYAGLAYAWWVRGVFGSMRLKDAESPARAAARKALELDDRLADAYAIQGYLQCIYDWDWAGAENTIKHALELDPNNVDAHYTYAMLLMALGRSSEAITQIQRAADRDPFSAQIQSSFGRILYRARRFDEAISYLNRAIALEPRNLGAHARLGDVYAQMGQYAEALAAYEKGNSATGDATAISARVARVYARMGKRNEARQVLAALRKRPAGLPLIESAGAYTALGYKDEAFRLLFRNLEERSEVGIFVNEDPPFDELHSDPRWQVLLRRMNFPTKADGPGNH